MTSVIAAQNREPPFERAKGRAVDEGMYWEYFDGNGPCLKESAMRFASISFALLLAPVVAVAQSSGSQPPVPEAARVNQSPVAVLLSNVTGACPVGLHAQRRGTPNMVMTDGKAQREAGPTVRLTVNNLQDKNIVGATVRVRGYGSKPQLFPIQGVSPAGKMTKTVSLKLNVAGGKNGEADVTAERFGSISRIYLESMEYADGTEWHADREQPCSVEPDLLMLVASR